MNADFLALLEKAGLTKPEAKATAGKFAEYGYGLTKEYVGAGNDLVQNDHQLQFLIDRLLRRYSPMKRLDSSAAADVFRSLQLEGYRIKLPKTYPNVP